MYQLELENDGWKKINVTLTITRHELRQRAMSCSFPCSRSDCCSCLISITYKEHVMAYSI